MRPAAGVTSHGLACVGRSQAKAGGHDSAAMPAIAVLMLLILFPCLAMSRSAGRGYPQVHGRRAAPRLPAM